MKWRTEDCYLLWHGHRTKIKLPTTKLEYKKPLIADPQIYVMYKDEVIGVHPTVHFNCIVGDVINLSCHPHNPEMSGITAALRHTKRGELFPIDF